jgi:hypothetical protein
MHLSKQSGQCVSTNGRPADFKFRNFTKTVQYIFLLACSSLLSEGIFPGRRWNFPGSKAWFPKSGVLFLTAITLLCDARFAKADPIGVSFTSTHLSGSEWRYDYTVSGSYAAQDDLAIYFPYSSDSVLTDLETGGSGWTTFVFQPDTSLPADGEFDLVANVDDPGLGSVFSVDFSYSGTGSPGTQDFTLFDPSFNVLASGNTQAEFATTPEPASIILLATGAIALWTMERKRTKALPR